MFASDRGGRLFDGKQGGNADCTSVLMRADVFLLQKLRQGDKDHGKKIIDGK